MIEPRLRARHESRGGEDSVRERQTIVGDMAQLERFALPPDQNDMIPDP